MIMKVILMSVLIPCLFYGTFLSTRYILTHLDPYSNTVKITLIIMLSLI